LLFSVSGLLVPVSALEPGDEDIDLEITEEELYQEQREQATPSYTDESYQQWLKEMEAKADEEEEKRQQFVNLSPGKGQLIIFFIDIISREDGILEVTKALGLGLDSDSEGNNTPTPTTPTPTTPTPTTPTPTTSKFYVFTEYGDDGYEIIDVVVSSSLGAYDESGWGNTDYWIDITMPDGIPITVSVLKLPEGTANIILDSNIIEDIDVTGPMVRYELVDPVDVISLYVRDIKIELDSVEATFTLVDGTEIVIDKLGETPTTTSPSIIPLLDTTPPLTKSIIIPSTTPLMPPFTTPFTTPFTSPFTSPSTTPFTTPFTGDEIPNTSQIGPERPIGNFLTDSNYDDGSNGAFDQELWNTLNDVPTHRWVLMNDLITSEYFWDGGPVTQCLILTSEIQEVTSCLILAEIQFLKNKK